MKKNLMMTWVETINHLTRAFSTLILIVWSLTLSKINFYFHLYFKNWPRAFTIKMPNKINPYFELKNSLSQIFGIERKY